MAITHYSEETFAIDLIGDVYKTTDPVEIIAKSQEILDISLTVSEVLDYLTRTEDFEKESSSVHMRELFNEQVV